MGSSLAHGRGNDLVFVSAGLKILKVRLRDLSCSCSLFAVAFCGSLQQAEGSQLCWGLLGQRGLSAAASRAKSCRFVAGAMQQSKGLLLPPPKHHCHLKSIVAASLPWHISPTQHGLVRGLVWWVLSTSHCSLSSGAALQHSSISSPGLCCCGWTDRMSCGWTGRWT